MIAAPTFNRSGFSALVRAVRADFKVNAVPARVTVGLTGRQEWQTPTVAIISGHWDGSNSVRPMGWGSFGAPLQKSSTNPIELRNCTREVTFDLFAVDVSKPSDEEANNDVLEELVERLAQALWAGVDPVSGLAPGSGPSLQLTGTSLLKRDANLGYGLELAIWATFAHPFYARPTSTQMVTGVINKGLVTAGGTTGTIARVVSIDPSTSTAIVAGLGFVSRDWIGLELTLSLAASSDNNGSFPILNVDGPDAVIIANPLAVAGDANDGAIAWSVVGSTS